MAGLTELVKGFSGKRIVVLGDLAVDEYVHGTTTRISREAPVLVVQEEGRDARLGCAANVVANVRALGGQPFPLGLVGHDAAGKTLLGLLEAIGVATDGILTDTTRFTTTKTRVLAGGQNTVRQQMLRIDRLNDGTVVTRVQDELTARLTKAVAGADALVVSDYGEGVVGPALFSQVLRFATDGGLPVFVDSRYRIEKFRGAEALTPNEPELSLASGMDLVGDGLEWAGRALLERSGSRAILVKRGRNGMALFLPGRQTFLLPAFGSSEVADVTGAGDTVLAVFSLARGAGVGAEDAARMANTAGGIKVAKSGTAVVSAGELIRALEGLR